MLARIAQNGTGIAAFADVEVANSWGGNLLLFANEGNGFGGVVYKEGLFARCMGHHIAKHGRHDATYGAEAGVFAFEFEQEAGGHYGLGHLHFGGGVEEAELEGKGAFEGFLGGEAEAKG